MNSPERILVDKEKVEINGDSAYRLFFYDTTSGVIIKVISYIAEKDIVLNKPATPVTDDEPTLMEDVDAIVNE